MQSADNLTMNSTLDTGIISQGETPEPEDNMSQSLLANACSAGNALHVETPKQ